MAEMASWFQIDKGYIYLTDEDILAWQEQNGIKDGDVPWNDFVGHHGIITVFGVEDRYVHHEGFVNMPQVIRRSILDGKMNTMFAHAGNLREATPEFIPMMKRLANRYPNVEAQLKRNPYLIRKIENASFQLQMEVGVQNGFTGSTIGQLLRHPECDEKSMLMALQGARTLMDEHSDHHHYKNIIQHANVTKKVLTYLLDNVSHTDVQELVKARMLTIKTRRAKKQAVVAEMNIQVLVEGKAKVRTMA